MAKGKFIVIDGGDGSGKTAVIDFLKNHFSNQNKYLFTREPGGSSFAEKIRSLMLDPDAKNVSGHVHFGLIWASRADHLEKVVLPAVLSDKHVFSDRFDSSTYAYQLYGQNSINLKDLFFNVRKLYVEDICPPDLYIFLDVEPAEGMRRIISRSGGIKNHFDDGDLEYYAKVRQGYLEFITKQKHVIVDANNSLENVKKEVLAVINKELS